ncbi:hypothetical protein K525DRAFT_255404 [Schizophyllum commune Loenen D]|nr:hypothetical protein K525DRAFT_255404 [Schizophyllum commune Loenen D]
MADTPAISAAPARPDAPVTEGTQETPKKIFGLGHDSNYRERAVNAYDYEQKYEADEYGEELGPHARFWRVLLDEARVYDHDMVEGWRDTLDVLLVFAGLFSAVVTTFVVQSSQALMPDYSQVAASLLIEMVALQRAWANGGSINDVPQSTITLDSVTSTRFDYWCNTLWFISLALSLSTALMAVLVKQWLQAYHSNVSGTPQDQALSRQFRLLGIQRWNVPLIIGLLPMLLHASLLLFFVGLSLYLFTIATAIAWAVTAVALLVYSLYLAANVLPMLDSQCPYRTPLSHYGYMLASGLFAVVMGLLNHLRSTPRSEDVPMSGRSRDMSRPELPPPASSAGPSSTPGNRTHFARRLRSLLPSPEHQSRVSRTPRGREAHAISLVEPQLMIEALTWVYDTSSNPSAKRVVLEAVSGLPTDAEKLISHNVMLQETLVCLDQMVPLEQRIPGALDIPVHLTRDCLARSVRFFAVDNNDLRERLEDSMDSLRATPYHQVLEDLIRQNYTSVAIARSRLGPAIFRPDVMGYLPFICSARPSSLPLQSSVWDRFIRFLAIGPYQDWHFEAPSNRLHLAIFIWRRAEAALDSEITPAAGDIADKKYKRSLQAATTHALATDTRIAISRLLYLDSSSDSHKLLARALELLLADAEKFDMTLLSPEPSHDMESRASVYSEEISFLARLVKVRLDNDQAWDYLDTMSRLAGLSVISTEARVDILYSYAGRTRTPSEAVLRRFLRFLSQLVVSVLRHPVSRESQVRLNDTLQEMYNVTAECPDLLLIVVPEEDALAYIRPYMSRWMETGAYDAGLQLWSYMVEPFRSYIRALTSTVKAGNRRANVHYIMYHTDDDTTPPTSYLAWMLIFDLAFSTVKNVTWMHPCVMDFAKATWSKHAHGWFNALWSISSHWLSTFPRLRQRLQTEEGRRRYRELRQVLAPGLEAAGLRMPSLIVDDEVANAAGGAAQETPESTRANHVEQPAGLSSPRVVKDVAEAAPEGTMSESTKKGASGGGQGMGAKKTSQAKSGSKGRGNAVEITKSKAKTGP